MAGIVFDGQKRRFIPLAEAAVPITDIGFQRGAGIFEAMLAYNGEPFHLGDHLKRLHSASKLLGIKEHYLSEYLREKVKQGIRKVKSPTVSIRIIITGGDSNNLLIEKSPRLYIIFTPFHPEIYSPKENYSKGVSLMTSSILRTLPDIKSLNCLGAVVSNQAAKRKKYYDAIYATQDYLLEGTTFNFAIIIKNNLITPIDNVLEGISMQLAIKLAKKIGLNIFRKHISFKELRKADEAFITSASRKVMPVIKVDNIKIGNGRPGPYSKKLLELFDQETLK